MKNYQKIALISGIAVLFALTPVFNTALAAPGVTTGSSALTGPRSVEMEGFVSSGGLDTLMWFQLSTNSSMQTVEKRIPSPSYISGQNTGSLRFVASRINLLLDTTYYYRAVAQNSSGTSYGEIKNFRTTSEGFGTSGGSGSSGSGSSGSGSGSSGSGSSTGGTSGSGTSGGTSSGSGTSTGNSSGSGSSLGGSPTVVPSVLTNGPGATSSNEAVIYGSINPNGGITEFWFEFGTTTGLGKSTSVERLGNTGGWQLVTGNLSALEPGKTYYYRAAGRNNLGISRGEIKTFTTQPINNGRKTGSGSGTQVLGAFSGSSSIPSSNGQDSLRPSFMSLEYSLSDDDSLILVANEIRPRPGDTFSYTVVYKNDTNYDFNETNLKVIIPSEAYYNASSIEPLRATSNIVDFDLGTIRSGEEGEVVITVNIKDDVAGDANLIFTSVLGYKNGSGLQLASTNYMTVKTGQGGSRLAASIGEGIFSSSLFLWLIAFGLVILLGIVGSRLAILKRRDRTILNAKAKEAKDPEVPPTFEEIGDVFFKVEK